MSGKLVTRATEADIVTARDLKNQYDPDGYGRFPWVTRDYGGQGKSLNLSVARLGTFMVSVLRHGGDITSIHAMRPDFPRCYVQASVRLTVQAREAVIAETGITIESPPVMRVGDVRVNERSA